MGLSETINEGSIDGGSDTHVQSTEPDVTEGDAWVNPDNGVYQVAYNTGWHPVPPVRVIEEASTFSESDVTLTHNLTAVDGQDVHLPDFATRQVVEDCEDGDLTVGASNWSGWSGDTSYLSNLSNGPLSGNDSRYIEYESPGTSSGVNIARDSGTQDGCGLQWQTSDSYSGVDYIAFLFRSASGADLIGVYFNGDGSVTINGQSGTDTGTSWSRYTTYRVEVIPDWDNGEAELFIDGTSHGSYAFADSPSNFGELEIRNAPYDSGNTNSIEYDNIEERTQPYTGDCVIEWPSPADVESWDLATYQKAIDSEAVEVDVEDGAGNVLFSDISQNFDISTVDASKDVRLRARFTRDSLTNDPRLGYAARRYVR